MIEVTTKEENGWISVHIYTGTYTDSTDMLIVDFAELVDSLHCNWFFLRYADAHGAHVRLRLRRSGCTSVELWNSVEPCLLRTIERLSEYPIWPASRLVTIPGQPAGTFSDAVPRILRVTYSPELEKYGGITGIDIAERQFSASSDFAAWAIRAEQQYGFSRKSLAPYLLNRLVSRLIEPERIDTFLEEYSRYWLLLSKAEFLGDSFTEKAQELVQSGTDILLLTKPVAPDVEERIAAYVATVFEAMSAYQAIPELNVPPLLTSVLTNFIHLLHNRLGFVGAEEAYIATLTRFARSTESVANVC